MRFFRSIRFRLSALYSAVVFGLGGLALLLVYLAIRWQLTRQTRTVFVVRGEQITLGRRTMVMNPVVEADQVRTLQSLFDQYVLDRLAFYMLLAMGLLFVLSLVVGWVISGRALAPVDRISRVAQEIEASDLSRRIALKGPDDELSRLAGTFDAMLDRLEKAFSSQRRFLADTSHDLRNPLAAIRSNVEVTLGDANATAQEWRQTGDVVVRNAARMGAMIEDLLAAARLQTGEAAMVEVDLGELVEQVARDAGAASLERSVDLITAIESVRVKGDATSLTRALGNLLDNSLKASAPGQRVRLASGSTESWAYLSVDDQGAGFDPVDARGGLGLSIVRQVAEAHRGQLTFRSEPGSGTSAMVWIPVSGEGPPPASTPLPSL